MGSGGWCSRGARIEHIKGNVVKCPQRMEAGSQAMRLQCVCSLLTCWAVGRTQGLRGGGAVAFLVAPSRSALLTPNCNGAAALVTPALPTLEQLTRWVWQHAPQRPCTRGTHCHVAVPQPSQGGQNDRQLQLSDLGSAARVRKFPAHGLQCAAVGSSQGSVAV